MAIAYLDGVWQAIHDAKVSVLDRGFMFGDAVYEVIPVYRNKPFMLVEHIQRLATSLAEIKIHNPMSTEQWLELIGEAIFRAEEAYALVYVQVTRGVAQRREHVWPENASPTILVTVSGSPALAETHTSSDIKPYVMIIAEDFRWQRGDLKSTCLLAAGLFKNEALAQGADDAILIRDGLVTESSSSNVFVVIDNVLVTPPKSRMILHGITRDLILTLARELNIPVEERDIKQSELAEASEIMVSSAGREVWPVGVINGISVGNGGPGVVWDKLNTGFQVIKDKL
ncbi:MAG: aminotransferase class IV [Pseudomonadales bacterium]|nr:aminotransferase class IV [Pseudomonadales bacterium]